MFSIGSHCSRHKFFAQIIIICTCSLSCLALWLTTGYNSLFLSVMVVIYHDMTQHVKKQRMTNCGLKAYSVLYASEYGVPRATFINLSSTSYLPQIPPLFPFSLSKSLEIPCPGDIHPVLRSRHPHEIMMYERRICYWGAYPRWYNFSAHTIVLAPMEEHFLWSFNSHSAKIKGRHMLVQPVEYFCGDSLIPLIGRQ